MQLDYNQRKSLYDLIISYACGNEKSGILAKEIIKTQGICIELKHMNISHIGELDKTNYDVKVIVCLTAVYMWKKELNKQKNYGDILKVTGYMGGFMSCLFLPKIDVTRVYKKYEKQSYSWYLRCKYFNVGLNINSPQ